MLQTAPISLAILILAQVALLAQDQSPGTDSRESDASDKKSSWSVASPDLPLRPARFKVTEGTWISSDVSADGKEIVFDLLGDLYVLPIEGGTARRLRGGMQWDFQPRFSPDGKSIAYTSDEGGGDNLWVMDRDGSNARAVTKEKFRLLSSPSWSPDGRYLVGRKHFTSRRSLGAGEMWLYPLTGGPGIGLTKRRTDEKDSGEPVFSPDGRHLYWSEDVTAGKTFEYNKNPNAQIYVIMRADLEKQKIERFISGSGGAVRPQPSPDGKKLAFVRRVGTESVLFLRDLETNEDTRLFSPLFKDAQETWAIHGVYPGFSWTPDSREIVIYGQGKLLRVDAKKGTAREIPFEVDVDMQVVETVRFKRSFGGSSFRTRVCRWPAVSHDGRFALYQAMGRIHRMDLSSGLIDAGHRLDIHDTRGIQLTPAFAPDGKTFAFTSWHDSQGGALLIERADSDPYTASRSIAENGQFIHPRFSPDGKWIVYQKLAGDAYRGRAHTKRPGIYRTSVDGKTTVFISARGARPRFDGTGTRILVEERGMEKLTLVSTNLDGFDTRKLVESKYATEFEISPDGRWLAFTELWNAYVCPLPATGGVFKVSSKLKTVPVARLTRDAGQDLSFSGDSKTVYCGLASEFAAWKISDLFEAPYGTREATDEKPPPHHASSATIHDLSFEVQADVPTSNFILHNIRIVTMRGDEVIENSGIYVRGNRIHEIGTEGTAPVAEGVPMWDGLGATVVPGYIDTHAHIRHGSQGIHPEQNWQHVLNLAFGVTTTHDPSNDTRLTYAVSELQQAGRIVAPRIFSTGTILYGADGGFKAVIDSLDDAASHIRRTAAFGPFTVKSYNQPRRDQRQQVLKAAREQEVMVVPEGGSTLQHNLTQIVDGHTTLEHALPAAPLYDDVLQLFSKTGTAYTPTLIVGYGGIWGERYWYQESEVWKHPVLARFMPRGLLAARARRREMAPEGEYHHFEIARSAAELARRGVRTTIGAHGQIQGLGVHWEMWMYSQGGMSNHDVLRTATIWGAEALGLDQHVGSLEPGKLADFVLLGGNPLYDIRQTEKIRSVVLNGRMYDLPDMSQVIPDRRKLPPLPPIEGLQFTSICSPSCCVHRQ